MSFHIYLDTRDKDYGINADCSFSLANSQLNLGTLISLSVESAIIPNLQYTINNNNNRLYLKENNGSIITIIIPESNYTGSELATQLQSSLNSAGTLNYTVTYNTQNKKFAFSVLLPDIFQFVSNGNSINNIIGFDGNSPNLSVFFSTYPVRLDGSEYIDLELVGVRHDDLHTSNRRNTIARVPLTESFGGIIYFVNPDNFTSLTIPTDLFYRVRIRIVNPDGTLFQLPDNGYVSIVLRCTQL